MKEKRQFMLRLKTRSDIHQILAITDIDENRDRGFLEKHVKRGKKKTESDSSSDEDDDSQSDEQDQESENVQNTFESNKIGPTDQSSILNSSVRL